MKALPVLFAGLLSMTAALPLTADPTVEKVMTVNEVRFQIDKTDNQKLVVVTTGTVSSGGWTDARLRAKFYEQEPADGILDVDFVAAKPDGAAAQVVTPVSAKLQVPVDSWVRGVRVHARDNSVQSNFGG